jgi:hypothetical protein
VLTACNLRFRRAFGSNPGYSRAPRMKGTNAPFSALIVTSVLFFARAMPLRLEYDQLPDSYAPCAPGAWNNSITLRTVTKDDNATDILEWLRYYQCVPRLNTYMHLPNAPRSHWSLAHVCTMWICWLLVLRVLV